jgi:hypothetical protein
MTEDLLIETLHRLRDQWKRGEIDDQAFERRAMYAACDWAANERSKVAA